MSNRDRALVTAQQAGQVSTLYLANFKLPMVAPQDLGVVSARLLQEPNEQTGLYYVEGPERYSSADVAAAFSDALGKAVKSVETPGEKWVSSLQPTGFAQPAAESMAAMTAITLDQTTRRMNCLKRPSGGTSRYRNTYLPR
ncbi:hypothetical protein GCM10028773_30620 [Spirosoma koreense]